MIIQCQGCVAKYLLPSEKVPSKAIKVRCPKCGAVFRISPDTKSENIVAKKGKEVLSSAFAGKDAGVERGVSSVTVEERNEPVAAKSSKKESKDDRAKRLARVLVSDILWYNKDKRDQALIDGNLMTVLGEEIKKSWELYKEKVGVELANSTGYFKEALNEILADGQKIF